MDAVDLTYLGAVSLVGASARAVAAGLPEGVRMRLEAKPPVMPPGWIWVHAVSVGELLLADGLLVRLREQALRIHVTTGTPAGLSLMQQRLAGWDGGTGLVTGGAFPLDDPEGLAPFLQPPPSVFLALETELWPNLLRALEVLEVPSLVVNGRLTSRTLGKGGAWIRRAARRLSLVAARDPESRDAFMALGAPRVELGGNLKADAPPPRGLPGKWASLRRAWDRDPILVAGNTLEGEEGLVLEVWETARRAFPGTRLILAPRQPRRFEEVAELLRGHPLGFVRASDTWPEDLEAWQARGILLLDTLGDLAAAYGEGSLALVGGGWNWHGGHNPLEAVRWGIPTLIGPGYSNFADLVEPLAAEGLLQVADSGELGRAVVQSLGKCTLRPMQPWGAQPLPPQLCGTLDRTLRLIQPFLPTSRFQG